MTNPISCRQLVKKYDEKLAVAGIDLEVRPGICFGLLGPNGAGKTTTIRMLVGLLLPDEGHIYIGRHDVAAQPRLAFANVRAVLGAAGAGLGDVVKTTVFLATMDDFQAMNAVYAEAFGDHRPARSAFAVGALPVGALVEIEVIAEAR